MGRRKEHEYTQSAFARRIAALQEERGYSDSQVMEGIVDGNGVALITNLQTYQSHKSGKRMPRDLDIVVPAYAGFYGVTADYILGIDDTPNPQVKSVQDATGLSGPSVRVLMLLREKSPHIMNMIDAIISGANGEDITYYCSLYFRIYEDYKASRQEGRDPEPERVGFLPGIQRMQDRFFFTQHLYEYWRRIVTDRLSRQFDREILAEEDMLAYENSPEGMRDIRIPEDFYTEDPTEQDPP